MNTAIYILIPLSLIIGFAIKFFYKKEALKTIAEKPFIKLNEAELDLITLVNLYRVEKNLKELSLNNDLKHFTEERTAFWKKENYTSKDNSHNLLGLHQRPYINTGLSEIKENAAINAYPFTAFKNSSAHNETMLSNKWDFISVSIKKYNDRLDYICLAFGKASVKKTWFK